MLIKKQQKISLETSAEVLFSALVNGVSRRQETAVSEAPAWVVSTPDHSTSLPLCLVLNLCLQASSCWFPQDTYVSLFLCHLPSERETFAPLLGTILEVGICPWYPVLIFLFYTEATEVHCLLASQVTISSLLFFLLSMYFCTFALAFFA